MILVTGGTGLVGSHLLYKLIASGEKVRAIRRKSSDLSKVKQVFGFFTKDITPLFDKIEWVEADITNIPQLETAFQGIKEVYHAAALISFNGRDRNAMRKVNIEGTANIVNLCVIHKVQKLCFVSSIATLGAPQENGLITEESYWNPETDNNDYAISKYGAEMEVWRGTREGVPAVIVNPGVILGAGFPDQGSGKLFQMAKKGLSFYTEGKTGFVDVEDVVTVMKQLMDSEIQNELYILIAENVAFKEIVTELSIAMDQNPPRKKAGKYLLGFVWRLDLIANVLFGKEPAITRASAKAAIERSSYDNSKIKNALSYEFTPLTKTIENVIRRFNY
ncbi:NAD-dependent epimerase/dehydratase family protein [Flavobacteriaceae bacterium M23B6Z8]